MPLKGIYWRKKEDAITFPPTFIPSAIKYTAGGGLGAACVANRPFGLSTNSHYFFLLKKVVLFPPLPPIADHIKAQGTVD